MGKWGVGCACDGLIMNECLTNLHRIGAGDLGRQLFRCRSARYMRQHVGVGKMRARPCMH